jgi:hypothetical protein
MYRFIDLSTSRVDSAGLASIPIRSFTKSSPEPIRGSFRNSRNGPYVSVSILVDGLSTVVQGVDGLSMVT